MGVVGEGVFRDVKQVYEALDSMPPAEWLVPPWHKIRPEERLRPDEMKLLREIVERRRPQLLGRLEQLGARVQRPSERAELQHVLLDEQLEQGVDHAWNAYGTRVDDLIGRLQHI